MELQVHIGKAVATAIIDTGSQLNLISEKIYAKSGLVRTDENTSPFTDASGKGNWCIGSIPEAEVFITLNKLRTPGPELSVMEDPPFQVILGRPWLTLNEVNIEERPDGTYIRLERRGKTYLINVCPKPRYKIGGKTQRPVFAREQTRRKMEAYPILKHSRIWGKGDEETEKSEEESQGGERETRGEDETKDEAHRTPRLTTRGRGKLGSQGPGSKNDSLTTWGYLTSNKDPVQLKELKGSGGGVQGSDQDKEGDDEEEVIIDLTEEGGWRGRKPGSQDKGDDDESNGNHERNEKGWDEEQWENHVHEEYLSPLETQETQTLSLGGESYELTNRRETEQNSEEESEGEGEKEKGTMRPQHGKGTESRRHTATPKESEDDGEREPKDWEAESARPTEEQDSRREPRGKMSVDVTTHEEIIRLIRSGVSENEWESMQDRE